MRKFFIALIIVMPILACQSAGSKNEPQTAKIEKSAKATQASVANVVPKRLGKSTAHCKFNTRDHPMVYGMAQQGDITGVFGGNWDRDKMRHDLVVFPADEPNKFRLYYAYDSYAPWGAYNDACIPIIGTKVIKNGKVVVNATLPNGAWVKYVFHGGWVDGEYTLGASHSQGRFDRITK